MIHGLARHDGWRLEQLGDDGETWQIVDQSVEGNDFWQAYQVPSRGDYDLIFNIHNRGTHQYRLVRGDSPCVGVLDGDARVCDDIDECTIGNGGCDQTCTNLEGSFVCSCDGGYELNTDGLLCDDVDECLVENGGCQQTCLNVVGDWRCECDPGFTNNDDGYTCDDIDECADAALNDCPEGEACTNATGSYVCGCSPPTCQPEGCTAPGAPNYDPLALLDDGSCFLCGENSSLSYRLTECDWDCGETWGDCFIEPKGDYCEFYFCESANLCTEASSVPNGPNNVDELRDKVAALGELIEAPAIYADDSTNSIIAIAPGLKCRFVF